MTIGGNMKSNIYAWICFFAFLLIVMVGLIITPWFQSEDTELAESIFSSETADIVTETAEYTETEFTETEYVVTEPFEEITTTIESEIETELDTLEVITEVYQSDENPDELVQVAQRIHESSNDTEYYINLTYDEKYLLAALLFHEGGSEVEEAQYAIVSVVINRMTTRGISLYDVVYETNQFSPAPLLTSTVPDASHLEVVEYICQHGPTIPEYVTFFRADRYFSPEEMYVLDYDNYGQTYFSYDPRVREQVEANNG